MGLIGLTGFYPISGLRQGPIIMLLQNLFHIKMKMAAAVQLGPLLDGMGGTSDQPSPNMVDGSA